MTFEAQWAGDTVITLTLFREACVADPTVTWLFLRATPGQGSGFLCGSNITLLQNAATYPVQVFTGAIAFCGTITSARSFFVEQYPPSAAFNPNGALTMSYNTGLGLAMGSLGPYTPTAGGGGGGGDPTALAPEPGLWWNPSESGTGYNIEIQHGLVVMTTYSFNADGTSQWYLSSGTLVNNAVSLGLERYRSGQCMTCVYVGPPAFNGVDGSVVLHFTSTTTGTLTKPNGLVVAIYKYMY